MRHFNDKFFGERLQKASEARQAMLKRAEKLPADHPDVLQRVAERQAIAAAREARNEAKAQAAIEQAERAAEAARKAREEADLAVAAQAEQKAARDARYAARKKRKA
jgi:hypothetical protein